MVSTHGTRLFPVSHTISSNIVIGTLVKVTHLIAEESFLWTCTYIQFLQHNGHFILMHNIEKRPDYWVLHEMEVEARMKIHRVELNMKVGVKRKNIHQLIYLENKY